MDAKGANPFLFTEDDFSSGNSANSNPFLMYEDEYGEEAAANDNPFLSQTAVSVAPNSTNPFAFDSMELGPSEGQAVTDITSTFQNSENLFMESSDSNLISATDTQEVMMTNVPPQKPTDLDLKHTNTVASSNTSNHVKNLTINGPSRPPPPCPPPSKETQDLLMSVMGAMDATSSHLLDKIPPTRTPSPVSMRDLHSPSPTPEPNFTDLVDVSEHKTEQVNDLLSLNDDSTCDINQNPPLMNQDIPIMQPIQAIQPTQPTQPLPPRPTPPPVAKPPRPLPPQKPPPPNFAQANQLPSLPPSKPPPPVAETKKEPEDFDMFGIEDVKPVPKPVASTADIMNLYSKPLVSKAETKPDLLFDSVETEVRVSTPPELTSNIVTTDTKTSTPADLTNMTANTEPLDTIVSNPMVAQDNFVSPEPSQSDLQMDTSDSQSKESISSVTFNPFAPNEEITSPVKPEIISSTLINTNEIENNINFTEFKKSDDEFDAFAMKFESAAKDENKNGAFDAFAHDTTSTWGNDGPFNDSTSGFDNEEPFDSFLAMQEPPTVPQCTPNRLSKAPSQDSDEDKDFSVFIRYVLSFLIFNYFVHN